MRNLCLILLLSLFASQAHAKTLRQEITQMRKQKETLILEQKKLINEVREIQQTLQNITLICEQKKKNLEEHQEEILKTLPLLARLERTNPFRLLVDPQTGQYRVRGVMLTRALISSIKSKSHEIQNALAELAITSGELEIKRQANYKLLENIQLQRTSLSLEEGKKIASWTKEEIERISEEVDVNTVLDESRVTKDARNLVSTPLSEGLPFRRLSTPVAGKMFRDAELQNRFSPHSQGIFFETQKNAHVTAPAKGTVVFRGPFRTHAEILIIDHGEKAHTIWIGMNKINAELGKTVYAGEKLGTMAGYGAEEPKLYVELRHKGKSIDPTPYFTGKTLE